jgi:N-acetyl-anhydromuramyl-L-alanine amidase AmpD
MTRIRDTRQDHIARIDHGRRPRTIGVTIHDTEADNLVGVRNYFATSSPDGVGAQLLIDDRQARQLTDLDALCYHAIGANSITPGIELCGFASWPRWRWRKRRTQLKKAANRTAWICWHYGRGLPRRRTNVWGHVDWPAGGHHDPGTGFPWPHFMRLCRRAYRRLDRTNGKRWL